MARCGVSDGPSSKSSQPHDSLFRYVFSDPQNAEGELRAALPAEVVSRLDWSTLRVVDGTLVDEEARHLYSDLIFEVAVAKVKTPVMLYVLLEHQSRSDPWMALRLLRYMARLWGRWLRTHPGATKLPAILPLVVHHDAVRWSAPRSFHELVDLPAELLREVGTYVPSYRYRVDDLSEQGVAELAARALTPQARVALACLARARHSADLLAELELLAEDVRVLVTGPEGIAAFGAVVSYILSVTDEAPERLREYAEQFGPPGVEGYMTGAEQLTEQVRKQALRQGRAEGRAEGREEGRAEGRAELLIALLRSRFGALSAEHEASLRAATAEQLDRWAARVFTVSSVDELFAS